MWDIYIYFILRILSWIALIGSSMSHLPDVQRCSFFSLLSFAIISCWIFLPRYCIRVSSLLKVLYTYSCLFQHVELYLFSYLLCGSCLVHLMVLHLWTFIVLLVFPSSELGAQMWINHGFIKIKLFSVLLHSLYWMHMVNVFEQNTQMDVCIELSFTILTLQS